ncbi:MAG: hypothetical protein LBP31_00245 [Holosporales bacterium]|jgi:hypothetical protein|nr:hypothetical protein [Holosporales bacterium]
MNTFFKLLLASSCALGVIAQGHCSTSSITPGHKFEGVEWKNPMFENNQSNFDTLHIPDGSVLLFSEGTDEKAAKKNEITDTGVVFGFTPIEAVELINELVNAKGAQLYGNYTLANSMIGGINTSVSSLEAFCVSTKNTGTSKKPAYKLYMSPLSTVVTEFNGEINVTRIRQAISFEEIYNHLFNNLGKSSIPAENAANQSLSDEIFSKEMATIKRRVPFDFKWRRFT